MLYLDILTRVYQMDWWAMFNVVTSIVPCLGILYLHYRGYYHKRYLNLIKAVWRGVLLTSSWNVPLFLIGDRYRIIIHPVPIKTMMLVTSIIWDTIYLILGLWVVRPDKIGSRRTPYPVVRYVLMEFTQKVVLEFISNGTQYYYTNPNPWNPVIFRVNGTIYTLLPYLIWIIASIIMYYASVSLTPLFKRTLTLPVTSYLTLDSDEDSW